MDVPATKKLKSTKRICSQSGFEQMQNLRRDLMFVSIIGPCLLVAGAFFPLYLKTSDVLNVA